MTAPPPLGSGQPDLPPQPAFRELSTDILARRVVDTRPRAARSRRCWRSSTATSARRRASVWLHHRRARELYLFASSDVGHRKSGLRFPASDSGHAAARGLRLEQPRIFQEAPEAVLIAPLRGWRRALGTLVVEGAVSDELTNRSGSISRVISRASCRPASRTSNCSRRCCGSGVCSRTPSTHSSISSSSRTRAGLVQMNDAFAMRDGRSRSELLDRPLHELVGPRYCAEWSGGHGEDIGSRTRASRAEHSAESSA